MQNSKELSVKELQQLRGGARWDKTTYLNKCVISAYDAALTGGVAAAKKGNLLGSL